MGAIKLKTKFVVLIVALLVASCFINVAWTTGAQRQQTETELRQQGQALAMQMNAVWDFMSANQDRFEETAYSETGSYQGLHCAVAGRTIAKSFTSESEYVTRFVNFNPRNDDDTPDEFEAGVLERFYADPTLKEYCEITEYEGVSAFRYMAPMEVKRTCLDCHGDPAGEVDVTGHKKEGWQVGDVGGAISIVIPMGVYEQAERANITQNVVFSLALSIAMLVIVYLALSHLVTRPLGRIRDGVERVQTGDLDVQLPYSQSSAEMNTLVAEFNKMTRELSEVYDGLEEQVSERTAQLEQANSVLERQRALLEEANRKLRDENRYKSDFLSMMSHELRTPLTSIIAFTEMLIDESAPATEREAVARREIDYNGRVLFMMINDILEMTRLDAGRMEMRTEIDDIGCVVDIVQSTVQPIADHKGIALTSDIAPDVPLVEEDFDKLRHALENLVGNAVKFTPEGGRVALSVTYDRARDQIAIAVSDSGIGIAKEDQERIFEKFVQADSSATRRYGGTGLGLSLAREYVEMHGGTIAVESELGRGSTFTMRIPTAQPKDAPGAPGANESDASKKDKEGAR